jgi:hypothetical protein
MTKTSILIEDSIYCAKFTLRSDFIVNIHFQNVDELSYQVAYDVWIYYQKLFKNKAYLNLFTFEDPIIPSKEARDFAASAERSKWGIAEAYVITNLPQRLVGNFYLNFNKPPLPTKMFENEKDAIQWLHSFNVTEPKAIL